MSNLIGPYEPLFQYAFEEGCRLPYKTVLASPQFRTHLERECTLYERYERDPDPYLLGILQMGHLRAGATLHETVHRQREEEWVWGLTPKYDQTVLRERALIHALGSTLIEAGIACLHPEMRELAQRWQEGSDKLKILVDLYNLVIVLQIKEREQRAKDYDPNLEGYEWIDMILKPYRVEDFLPAHLGVLGKGRHPSCLGLALILLSWAQLAGAKAMLVNVIETDDAAYWTTEYRNACLVEREIRARDLWVKPELRDSIIATIAKAEGRRHYVADFHPAVVIEIDGGWYYIDPYLNYLGSFNEQWSHQPGVAALLLDRYADMLPGLTMLANDGGFLQQWLARKEVTVQKAVEQSRLLGEQLTPGLTGEQFQEVLRRSPAAAYLVEISGRLDDQKEATPWSVVAHIGFGWDNDEEVTVAAIIEAWRRYHHEPAYQQEVHQRILGEFIRHALRRCADQDSEDVIFPIVVEYSKPVFGVALQVLNNLRCWGPVPGLPAERLMMHSSSQIYVHEALADGLIEDPILNDEGIAMLEIYGYRHLHPALRLRLAAIQKERGGE